jgi:hypothetical protein
MAQRQKSARGRAARAALPRLGHNLGLGRESGFPPGLHLARPLSAVHRIGRLGVDFSGTKPPLADTAPKP